MGLVSQLSIALMSILGFPWQEEGEEEPGGRSFVAPSPAPPAMAITQHVARRLAMMAKAHGEQE